jgi:propionyl-CoA carboxylase alpha chain
VSRPIHTLLIANRGEIARRIIRTASDMGIRTVVTFVADDADAPFVADADEAVRIASYLDASAIVAAGESAGADAVHPGYGYLAENADFARAVGEAGMIFVGPSPEVIAVMGDKLRAKELATGAGVPTLVSATDPADAHEVGYPLMVKAAAGGGGKGMRIVVSPAELADAVAAARREALSGFGDDTVFLERHVAAARHIEIQILGDMHGNLVHLGERECSIQRRHQKVIEESPSPALTPEGREAMGSAAVALGRALGYQNAGTVEFLYDDASGEFFFLEVNTRIQVEHPVTEEVTGIDLIAEQLRVAMGDPLGYDQADVAISGHAIEVRLYAEDPTNDFLPATGTLTAFRPARTPAVRWDSGVVEGSVIGTSFDPMIAKVIASAPTRAAAAGRLALALERLHLGGLTTNRDFLVATLRHPEFLAGATTTDFIERVAPARSAAVSDDDLHRAATAGALWMQGRNRRMDRRWGALPSGWRNGRTPPERVRLTVSSDPSGATSRLTVDYRAQRDGSFRYAVVADSAPDAPAPYATDAEMVGAAVCHGWSPTGIDVELDGRRSSVAITYVARHSAPGAEVHVGGDLFVQMGPTTASFEVLPRFVPPGREGPSSGFVAPMPGAVLEVRAVAGQQVAKGDTLVVLEAMKMEHHMSAPSAGTVTEVLVAPGDQVELGTRLLVFEPNESGSA